MPSVILWRIVRWLLGHWLSLRDVICRVCTWSCFPPRMLRTPFRQCTHFQELLDIWTMSNSVSVCVLLYLRVQLWCHSCMVSQLNWVFGSNSGDNCGLDSIIGSSCGNMQLWYYNFGLYLGWRSLTRVNLVRRNMFKIKDLSKFVHLTMTHD